MQRLVATSVNTVTLQEVENFPAFIIIDDKGNDFYAEIRRPLSIGQGPSK